MPEGDTIHLVAARINAALAGKRIELADAPNPRSPLHNRAAELQGATLEEVEAFGKHLVAHFSNELALHSHLGMNGRWFVTADGRLPYGRPWLRMAAGRAVASQNGGKILRIVSESRLRNDPGLRRLGPDPLRPGFDLAEAVERLRRLGAGREIGDALLDQGILAGVGNAIRVEALYEARRESLAQGRGARSRRARAGRRRDRARDADLGRQGAAAAIDLPRQPHRRLSALRRASRVARSGRRQPDRLLVPELSALAAV